MMAQFNHYLPQEVSSPQSSTELTGQGRVRVFDGAGAKFSRAFLPCPGCKEFTVHPQAVREAREGM